MAANRRWRRALIGTLAGALVGISVLPVSASASSTDVMNKVSAKVRAAAEDNSKITFWVRFSAKANLSAALSKSTKAAKGAEVRRVEIETADTSQAEVRKLLESTGADYQPFWISNAIRVTGDSKLLPLLAARPEVKGIDEAQVLQLPQPILNAQAEPKVDAVEWNIDRVNAPRVWNELGTRGEGIVVANIDSGVQFDHPALANQYRGKAANGALDHNYNWFDPSHVCPSAAPCDNNDHGTHTMGTMVGNDGGANIIGVAPGAKWIAAKGCETNSCSDAALLASAQWIVAPTDLNNQNPRPDLAPDIVNNSWGGPGGDNWYQDMVSSWIAAGIFPAFSNGNSGPACNTAGSPGDYTNSYSSGAFDINNNIASFSSRGSGQAGGIKPNIAAPGDNVRSSIPGGYDNFSGTSMASPHTAATVALMWSAAPAIRGDITATETLLDTTAIDVNATTCGGTAADNNVFGEGRLDAFAAVSQAPRGALGSLHGTVTSNGSPLAGVSVLAHGPIDRTFTTGADGTYSFPVLSVGDYTVTATKYGYVTASGTVTVSDGTSSTLDLSLPLAASATLTGTVTNGSGPVAGAVAKLSGTPLTATTNASGVFTITAPVGSYQLVVTSPLACSSSVTQTVALTSDLVISVSLPDRVDGFGYACGSSAEPYPSVSTLVSLTGDDNIAPVTLPFPVPFYGTNYSTASISTNGHVDFGATASAYSNVAIPDTAVPNGALYPLWDDWNVDASAGVYTGVVGTSPHRFFVVEWRNVRSYADANQRLSFVAMINEDGRVVYRYKDVAGTAFETGSSATIGLENATGTVGFQYSLNTAGAVSDSTAIEFRTTKHGVVRGKVTDGNDGLAVVGASAAFSLAGSPVGTAVSGADGSYLIQLPIGALSATTTAPSYQSNTQTLTLAAGAVATLNTSLATAKITVTPSGVDLVVPAGQTRTRTLTVTNVGGLGTPVALSENGGDVPWLGGSIATGYLAPGASTTLTVTVNSTGLATGSVNLAQLKLTSASGRNPDLLVPIKLVVPGFQAALDSGSNNTHVDPSGDTWTKDKAFVAGSCGYLGTSTVITTNKAITGTDDPARFANARENMYEYRCEGVANGTYTVELNFAEIDGKKANKRVFDVIIEGALVLPSLDIALEAGQNKALTKTYTVTVTDGVMNVRFITHTGFGKPIVSAVRVTHRPDLG